MKLLSLLAGAAALGTVALTCGACDSSSEDAPNTAGVDGGRAVEPQGDAGRIEGGVATPACILAEGAVEIEHPDVHREGHRV